MVKGKEEATPRRAVVLPGTLTDVVKAIREIIALFRDVASVATDAIAFTGNLETNRAATQLDHIRFPPHGVLRSLEIIASGNATSADLEELGRRVSETGSAARRSIVSLERCRPIIRKRLGMKVSREYEFIIHASWGKHNLRREMDELVTIIKAGATAKEVQYGAENLVHDISYFTERLIELHDLILSSSISVT